MNREQFQYKLSCTVITNDAPCPAEVHAVRWLQSRCSLLAATEMQCTFSSYQYVAHLVGVETTSVPSSRVSGMFRAWKGGGGGERSPHEVHKMNTL
jgi:hypothetical protein